MREIKPLLTGSWVIDPDRVFIENAPNGYMVGIPTGRDYFGRPYKHKWVFCGDKKEVVRTLKPRIKNISEVLKLGGLL